MALLSFATNAWAPFSDPFTFGGRSIAYRRRPAQTGFRTGGADYQN
jgi:hypothetical protein